MRNKVSDVIDLTPSIKVRPEIRVVPRTVRVPTLLIDYPLAGGVGGKRERAMKWKDTMLIVSPSLSPKALKVFFCLLAQKQEKTSMSAASIAPIVGVSNIRRDFVPLFNSLYDASLTFIFTNREAIPSGISPSLEKGKYVFRTRLIDSILFSFAGKRRVARFHVARQLYDVISKSDSYVTVELPVLQHLSSKTPVEILTYLLCLRIQRINDAEFLAAYFLAKSLETLRNIQDNRKANSLRNSIANVCNIVKETLKKLQRLNVISSYSFEETRIEVGGYTAPWFARLEIQKPNREV
jgi:hypothetical protein